MDILKQMKIESVKEHNNTITVLTTGAKYIIDKSGEKGKIYCYQRINGERLMATLDFGCSFFLLTVERKDESVCLLHQRVRVMGSNCLRIQIRRDSVLDILWPGGPGLETLKLSFSGNFIPDYNVEKNNNIILIDEKGGVAFYPCLGLRGLEWRNLTEKDWAIEYTFNAYQYSQLLFSVFPPREFNYEQSVKERISHHGTIADWSPPYPTDDEIEEASKYTNILVVHEGIWRGKVTRTGKPVPTWEDVYADEGWCGIDGFVPVSEKEFIRVIKKAHSLGMRIIPYMNPGSSIYNGREFLDIIENKLLGKYEMDGVYFDGLSYFEGYSDRAVVDSYQLIRDTRTLLQDKIIYLHYSLELGSRYVFYPFIDAYADYTLKSEGSFGFNDKYLRYVISGRNTSNSIGYICHSIYPMDFMRELIDKALAVDARFYLGMPEKERDKLLKEEYFPKLRKMER
ncbi:MAG: hypothetical protein HY606_04665 [Planctomycetes bacterium]|nr:hypothetical protein [Planctomycetota bacterium]